jgi:UDP-2-acetamido-2-deoxy-ribo-hexuluronate aminotransferase
LRHGQYIMGPEVKQLEDKLAAYVGVKHCITASSGTDTLLIAMMALGIGPGDEVITTPFTFIATGEMIALLGAKPVFVDIDPRTYNIDPTKDRSRHHLQNQGDHARQPLWAMRRHGCHQRDRRQARPAGDRRCRPILWRHLQGPQILRPQHHWLHQFFPSKPLGGYGDGGALFTNDDALAKAMKEIRVHGQDRRYHHPRIGINGRMDTLQAAIVLAKMERFDWEVEQRQKVGAGYTAMLKERCPEIVVPYIDPHNTSVYAQYTIQVANRDETAKHLNAAGVPTAVHYPVPIHLQPAFSKLGNPRGALPVAD